MLTELTTKRVSSRKDVDQGSNLHVLVDAANGIHQPEARHSVAVGGMAPLISMGAEPRTGKGAWEDAVLPLYETLTGPTVYGSPG